MFVDIGTTSKCHWFLVLFVSKMFPFQSWNEWILVGD